MPNLETVQQALQALSETAAADKLKGMDATILFDIPGEDGGQWTVTIDDGQIDVQEGATDSPTITVESTARDLEALVKGDLNPMAAFMQGKLKVKGDISMAMQLQKLFG